MTETTPIANDELRISVEAGDDYHATPRVAAALQELAAALEEAETDDVGGFGDPAFAPGFSMFYVGKPSFSYTENDPKGKKKGNVEYSWAVEQSTGV